MSDIEQLLLLFGIGIAAGMLNVSAGGGSALTLPALIFLGLDTALANGTNRIAIVIQNIFAVASFKKEKYFELKLSMKLAMMTIPGAVIGAFAATKIDDATFRIILGIVMIGIVVTMFIPRKKIEEAANGEKLSPLLYLAMLGVGFYGGFIQVGVGFIVMAVLYNLMRLSLVKVNMHKVFVILIYTIPALLVFIYYDKVDFKLGLGLAAGNALGGWWAAKLQIKKGEKYIRVLLITGILIISAKLFGLF